jgi:hypothetical protein
VAAVCLVAAATSGCGLSAELDREGDPGRTAVPIPVGTDATGHGRIVLPEPSKAGPSKVEPVRRDHACPSSGLRLDPGPIDAAMGLRGMALTLTNCGRRPYEVNGHPSVVHVLDRQRAPIAGVRCVTGTDKVFMAPADLGPEPFTLHPGESARAILYWRMAAEDGTYLRVAPQKGQRVVTLSLPDPLDIGPENTLGTTAWAPLP